MARKKIKKTIKKLVKKVFGKRKVTRGAKWINSLKRPSVVKKIVESSRGKKTKRKTKFRDGYKIKTVTNRRGDTKTVFKGGGRKRTVIKQKPNKTVFKSKRKRTVTRNKKT